MFVQDPTRVAIVSDHGAAPVDGKSRRHGFTLIEFQGQIDEGETLHFAGGRPKRDDCRHDKRPKPGA